MLNDGFASSLSAADADRLRARAHASRGSILTATSVAASGHPGGSMSSAEIYAVLFGCARLRPSDPRWPERDRIVVSHGHTSPGVYSALAYAGFFAAEEFEAHFREAGSVFEGHVERTVPGIEWSTGNLGQGLSAGVGMALAARMTGLGWHTYVVMSDGEQHKGQIAEARRLAVKEGLTDVTVVVDLNGIQISGATSAVMPVDIAALFRADGWHVIECDGHDIEALHAQVRAARADTTRPWAILARTTIGKGVSFMEGMPEFHGRGLDRDEYVRAMEELGIPPRLDEAYAARSAPCRVIRLETPGLDARVSTGQPRTYTRSTDSDDRSAWGKALVDIATENPDLPIAVLDCDLAVSVKTDGFAAVRPNGFVQCGVGEHNAATVAGALSASGVLTFLADFGVFGCDEVYNQQRLNDINETHLKLILTHCGLDVGEDGKTHQCLDYIGAFRNLFGWRVVVPADPNQTDRVIRAIAGMSGNVAVAMGRSKIPVLIGQSGEPAFASGYEFEYGRIDFLRDGDAACVLAMGTAARAAADACDLLAEEGIFAALGIVSAPLDLADMDMRRAASTRAIVSVEDHAVRTGLGASIAEWLALNGEAVRFVRLGVNEYQGSGPARTLMAQAGIVSDSVAQAVRSATGA